MASESANNTWETALEEGLLWACIAFASSWAVFFGLAFLDETLGREFGLIKTLFSPVGVMTDYLRVKGFISPDNWPGGLLVCYAAPWMMIGFVLGTFRGYFFKPSALSEKRGCLLTSFYVVIAVLMGVGLILVF